MFRGFSWTNLSSFLNNAKVLYGDSYVNIYKGVRYQVKVFKSTLDQFVLCR